MSQIPPYDSEAFPIPSLSDWQAAAGQPLDWANLEGLELKALYSNGSKEPSKNGARAWKIREDFHFTIPAEVGKSVKASLTGGASTVGLLQDEAGRKGYDPDQQESDGLVGKHGICLSTVPDMRTALDAYSWNTHSMHLEVGVSGAPMLGILVGLAIERGADFKKLDAVVGCDPLGELARSGRLDWELDDLYREAATGFLYAREFCPNVKTMAVNTEAYHEAGANAVQELALGLATGLEYFLKLQNHGLKPEEAARNLVFSWSVSGDLFTQVAKLRAARGLWNRLLKLHGAEKQSFFHARTGLTTHSWLDPHSNLLRSALSGFAAVLGGADSIEVAPFDRHLEHAGNNPDAARLARNQQLLMLYEAQLHRVNDPGAGSYYLEHLTQEIASKSWAMLQELHQKGMVQALSDGTIQKKLEETGQKRRERVSDGVDVLVGVNRYPLEPAPEPPAPFDQKAMQQNRKEHMARVRNGRDGGDVAGRLTRVAQVAGALDPTLIDAAAQAARVGATLGEITRAIRKPAVNPLEIPPIEKRSLAHPLEIRA